jgi:hypothetical protein
MTALSKEQIKLRDFLAVPFWALALGLDWIAIHIGGKWTAEMFLKGVELQFDELANNQEQKDRLK